MNTEETREVVSRFVQARASNDQEKINDLLADDASWQLPASTGLGPYLGREEVTTALMGGAASSVLDVSSIRRDVRAVIVDGERAVVQQRVVAKTVDGRDYVNEYCWVYTCRGGKIVLLEEYADSLYAARTFGWLSND